MPGGPAGSTMTRRTSGRIRKDYAPPPSSDEDEDSTSEMEAPPVRKGGKRKVSAKPGSIKKKRVSAPKKRVGGGASSEDDEEFLDKGESSSSEESGSFDSNRSEDSEASEKKPVSRRKKSPAAKSSVPQPVASGATNKKSGGGASDVQSAVDPFEFPIGSAGDTYQVLASDSPNDERVTNWFTSLDDTLPPKGNDRPDGVRRLRGAIGLDCEWCPPWFRDNTPERINTIQLYSPLAKVACLVLSVGNWDVSEVPSLLLELLADETIAKVGVNVTGDGSRLARDFDCPLNGLLNLEQHKNGSSSSRVTLESLCRYTCPESFHIDKDALEAKVRLGNWAIWPLSELQLKYASMDAVISFTIFLFQHGGAWATRHDLFSSPDACLDVASLQSCRPLPPDERKKLQSAPATTGKNANFFLMHQNRSIIPPNLHKKTHPKGAADALRGSVVVISGVLDSMSREDMVQYVLAHGGAVKKAITKSTTHLINDHGSVGPSKLKKCKAQGIPVVSEDVIFGLVAESLSAAAVHNN